MVMKCPAVWISFFPQNETIWFLKYSKHNKMKLNALLFLFGLSATVGVSQTTLVSTTFIIDDFDSHKEIVGALVSVRQVALTLPTLAGGKVRFDNVPVGEIEYYIMKEGYQFETGRVNVSTDVKTNVFRVALSKLDDKKILVTGEVTDGEGRDLKDAWVEVKIADQVRTVTTDASGNYSADIAPSVKYPSSMMRIEVKKGDCKKSETVDIPRNNVVYKDFKLDCKAGSKEPSESTDKTKKTSPQPAIAKFTKENWVFEVIACTQSDDRVECNVRVTSIGQDHDLRPNGSKRIISSTGNEYQLTEIKLGDKINQEKSFVANVPVNCLFVATNVSENIDVIAKLEVFFTIDNYYSQNVIPILRNIKVQ